MALQTTEQMARNLDVLVTTLKDIERHALKSAVQVVKTRLIQATPERVSAKQGGDSLEPGALKAAIRAGVHVGDGSSEDPSTTIVDFGRLSHIADFVDRGHQPPHSRAFKRAGIAVDEEKNTPAHPFVRNVEDTTREAAANAYAETIESEIGKVLNGNG